MPIKSGVKAINRQKFLAELGKLLTFMYEEDRQLALSYYERMFDMAEDEQALIQGLMSPTRQAVIIARKYNAKERKLSVSSTSKNEDGYQDDKSEIPPFVLAINTVFDELFPDNTPLQETVENQISLFDEETPEEKEESAEDEAGEEPEEEPEEEESEEEPEEEPEAEPEEELQEEEPAEEEQAEPEEEPAEEEPEEEPVPEEDAEPEEEPEEEPGEEKPQADLEDTQEFRLNLEKEKEVPEEEAEEEPTEPEEEPEEEPAPEKTEEDLYWEALYPEHVNPGPGEAGAAPAPENTEPEKEAAQAGEPAEEEPEEEIVSETEQEESLEWTRKAEPEEKPAEEGKPAPGAPQPAAPAIQEIRKTARMQALDEQEKKFHDAFGKKGRKAKKPAKEAEQPEFEGPVKRVAKVPLLVLFLIAAIPVTLALTAVLLIPTGLSLAGAVGAIALGTVLIMASFAGFAMFSDIMLLLGSAIVALALGLLLLWLFIWFIGGVIGGLIRAVKALGRKWCYKEVPAE